ncbi:MAG: hypothetical protein AAB539_03920 [Patescibacteria group bacterium]
MTIRDLVNKILVELINPVIVLLFAVATVVFIWGIIQYVIGGTQGSQGRLGSGKNVIIWGIIGMFIMASAWGMVKLLCDFFSVTCGDIAP